MQVNDLIDIYSGERKYLNREERKAFKKAAIYMEPKIRTFCLMIYYTGCRLGEALEITPDRLDYDGCRVLLRTLKQNRKNPDRPDRYRLVELPFEYIATLESCFKARTRKGGKTGNKRLWDFTDRTGQNYIKKVMNAAEITGKKASSRGLRHSMGVMLALDKVPLNVIQDILGHKFPESTQIYMQVLGEDRRTVD
jgi:integrase/recombinase XerD